MCKTFTPSVFRLERFGTIKKCGINTPCIGRAIITGENDKGILIESKLHKFLNKLPHLIIKIGDHASIGSTRISVREIAFVSEIGFFIAKRFSVPVDIFLWNLQWVMRNGRGKIKEEWLIFILIHKVEGFRHHQVCRILILSKFWIAGRINWICSFFKFRAGNYQIVIQKHFFFVFP